MWLEAEKARNFNAVVWVLGEVNGYHYVDLFFNLLSDKSTDRRADITHSVMAVLRKDFIGFTRLPWRNSPIPLTVSLASVRPGSALSAIMPVRSTRRRVAVGCGLSRAYARSPVWCRRRG